VVTDKVPQGKDTTVAVVVVVGVVVSGVVREGMESLHRHPPNREKGHERTRRGMGLQALHLHRRAITGTWVAVAAAAAVVEVGMVRYTGAKVHRRTRVTRTKGISSVGGTLIL
jgi:hypothetical protein